MKPATPLLALLPAVLAKKTPPFILPTLTTHQPNGNPAGQVNYYRIAFDITHGNVSGYCNKFWGDNSWTQPEAYSVNVPTNTWFACDSSKNSLGDGASPFEFLLYPYFSIGNFSVGVREGSFEGYTHFTNKTDAYTCTINPIEVQYQQHAQGDCSIADGKGPFKVKAKAK